MTTTAAEALVVLVTVPDAGTADKLAEALVGERLAACVNVLGGVRSVYRWQGAVERSDELLCLCKTTRRASSGCARASSSCIRTSCPR